MLNRPLSKSRNKPSIVVVALAGRALAHAAVRCGFCVSVIDAFGDQDTRDYAEDVQVVAQKGGGLAPTAVQDALAKIRDKRGRLPFVVGSGLEHCPWVLDDMSQYGKVLGNGTVVVQGLKDPVQFFGLLADHKIAFPAVAFQPTTSPDPLPGPWLVKGIGAAGGGHIRRYSPPGPLPAGCYLQRYVKGTSYSVVFLADGEAAHVVGYNQLWQASSTPSAPFLFGGAVALSVVPHAWKEVIQNTLNTLTRATGLRGLCGMDFIVDPSGRIVVLEVNPRPPASFELHDRNEDLLVRHVKACDGRLFDNARVAQDYLPADLIVRAQGVLYAHQTVVIPSGWHWPTWATDCPQPGSVIESAAPICLVHGIANAPALAKEAVLTRTAQLWKRLENHAMAA